MRLKAGVYDFPEDRTNVHNIHLLGPGVDRRTSVAGITMTANRWVVWWRSVKLKPGKLTSYSDRAPTQRISITVVP